MGKRKRERERDEAKGYRVHVPSEMKGMEKRVVFLVKEEQEQD